MLTAYSNSIVLSIKRLFIAGFYQIIFPEIPFDSNDELVHQASSLINHDQSNITSSSPDSLGRHDTSHTTDGNCSNQRLYRIPASNNLFRVIVEPSTSFGLDDDFKVLIRRPSDVATGFYDETDPANSRQQPEKPVTDRIGCFYNGYVMGVTSSRAVISVRDEHVVRTRVKIMLLETYQTFPLNVISIAVALNTCRTTPVRSHFNESDRVGIKSKTKWVFWGNNMCTLVLDHHGNCMGCLFISFSSVHNYIGSKQTMWWP